MNPPHLQTHLSDEQVEQIICRELRWSFCASDIELIGIIDLDWDKVTPDKDPLPERLSYDDDAGTYVLISARCLVCDDHHFFICRDYFLYTLEDLASAGNGPVATPQSFADIAWDPVDLTAPIESVLCESLINFSINSPERIASVIAGQPDANTFIASIKSDCVRQGFKKLWKKQRKYFD